MYCWPQELVEHRGRAHLQGCGSAKGLTTSKHVDDALAGFEVLFYDQEMNFAQPDKAWAFVGPSICFCIFVLSM